MDDITAKKLQGIVAKNLKQHECSFRRRDFEDDECAIDTDILSRGEVFRCYEIRLLFRKWDMQTLYYLPVKAPAERRQAVSEYLTRANWRTRWGKFVLDFEDGELRYEMMTNAAAIVADVEDVLGDVFNMLRHTIDDYAPGLLAVVAGSRTPEQAMADFDAARKARAEARAAARAAAAAEEAAEEIPEEEPSEPPAEEGVENPVPPRKKAGKTRTRVPLVDPPTATPKGNYSLEGLNLTSSVPLADIISAVKKFRAEGGCPDVESPRLNILLSGAPGSGKTAFVKHLAQEVGAPIKVLKASDLISRYSGETEKRIAKAFSEAKEEEAILFLDEVDSFLQDRAGSTRSWEVSQVNELLQQMEEFSGVMVGATNFTERLDKAVLRRFTYKITLDYLTNEGKEVFFRRYFKEDLSAEESVRLNAIVNLTPGDFRTVREELYYLADRQTNAARLAALEAESAAKGKAAAQIGF